MIDESLVSWPVANIASEPRLALRPDPPIAAHLDGAWWPRSADLAIELPGLLSTLAHRLGPVNLVGYHVDAWTQTPPLRTPIVGCSTSLTIASTMLQPS